MRILHLITRSEPGGGQTIASILAGGAGSAGHKVAIAYGPEGNGEAWVNLDPSIERIPLPNLRRSISPARDLRALGEISRLCASWKPDILHLHTSKAAALGRLAGGIDRRRIVYTMHGYDQLKTANRKLLHIDKALRKRCGAVVAVSRRDRDAMNRDGYGALYIPNGVGESSGSLKPDNPAAKAMRAARSKGMTIALAVARDAPPKRVDILRAAARLLEGYVEIFWIGGLPTPQDPPNFNAMGALSDASAYLGLADIFLLASEHEGMPVSLLEAFSAGLSVVASGVGGIPELLGLTAMDPERAMPERIVKTPYGYIARNEVIAFADAIADLASNHRFREEAGKAARLAWQKEYSAALMVERYGALYDRIRDQR